MNYLELAEQAKGEKAHVAVVMYYRNAAEQASDSQTIEEIVGLAVDYAGCLKKGTDQRAVYGWAKVVAAGTELVERINTAMEKLRGQENDITPPTA